MSGDSMRVMAKIGLLMLALGFVVVFFAGAIRLPYEYGAPASVYLAQNVIFALAGAGGATACVIKSARLDKLHRLRLEAWQFTADRFEAHADTVMVVLMVAMPLAALWVLKLAIFKTPINLQALSGACLFTLLMGWALVGGLSQLRAGRAILVMDADALDHTWYGPIRWGQVRGIHLREKHRRWHTQYALVLLVRRPGRYLSLAPWWMRLFVGAKRRDAAIGTIEFPLGLLNKPALKIYKAAVTLRSRVSPPPLDFWVPGMPAHIIGLLEEMDAAHRRLDEIGESIDCGRLTPDQVERQTRQVTTDFAQRAAKFRELARRSQIEIVLARYAAPLIGAGMLGYMIWRVFSLYHG